MDYWERGQISVWRCNPIRTDGELKKPLSDIVNNDLVVKDLWNSDKSWNDQIIRNIFNNSFDVEKILKIYIPHRNKDGKKI